MDTLEIPALSFGLRGILAVAAIQSMGVWSHLIAPDGSNRYVTIDPNGTVSYTQDDSPYTQFIVSADGQKASIMPLRSGGPLPGAEWMHYGIIEVPTAGL